MSNWIHRIAVVLGTAAAALPAAGVIKDPRIGVPMAVVGVLGALFASLDKVTGAQK